MLKLLACLFMLLDHIGYYYADLLPGTLVVLLRTVGRLAFPIFAWSVARGYMLTRNAYIYFVRMSGFALFAEIVIRWSNHLVNPRSDWLQPDWTNVLITFSLAIVLLAGYRLVRDSYLDMVASLRPIPAAPNTLPVPPRFDVRINIGGICLDPRVGLPLGLVAMAGALFAAEWLRTDYGWYGLMTVLGFYVAMHRVPEAEWEVRSFLYLSLINASFLIYRLAVERTPAYWAILQVVSILAIPVCMRFRTAKKPPLWLKYAFYLFYPLHILVLCLLRRWFFS